MNNKGKVTVFMCLITSSVLLLALTMIKVIDIYIANAEVGMVSRSAVSGVKSEYNSYIFENYHILLFDKNAGGKGEGYYEEQMLNDISDNLGQMYGVQDVAFTDFLLLMDDSCNELKKQINDYIIYAGIETGIDTITEKTDGKDGSISNQVFEEMDENINKEKSDDSKGGIKLGVDDPRDFTKNMSDWSLLSIVVPEDLEVSDVQIDISSVPSINYYGTVLDINLIDKDFNNYSELKTDLKSHASWFNSLKNAGVGVAYAKEVFNCATNQDVNEETVFSFELEYLIGGKSSDAANLNSVVKDILLMRLPINYAYLISDASKMTQIRAISVPLSFVTFIPEPILTYLIAGCWSYVEAMVDVRMLLEGKNVEFAKTKNNWVTDLNNFEESVLDEYSESDKGLCYEDYLMILMAMDMEKTYYRMLDLMELNAKQYDSDFEMENAAVKFAVDITVNYKEQTFKIKEIGGY